MPARNAPSASDRPASSVSAARPSVTSSTFSMKSSELFCRATRWNHARIGLWPANRISVSATAALTAAIASAFARSPPLLPSDGNTIRNATTARSWNSRIAHDVAAMRRRELHPLGEHLRHDRRRAHRQRAAERDACLPAVARETEREHRDGRRDRHLREPQTEHRAPHRLQLRQAELEPDREHQEHDPEFRELARFGRVGAPTPVHAGPRQCRPAR